MEPDERDEQIAALRAQVEQLTRERDEARAGYSALDRSWARAHQAAMGPIREAVGNPDATVPEIVATIRAGAEAREKLSAIVSAVQAAIPSMARAQAQLRSDSLASRGSDNQFADEVDGVADALECSESALVKALGTDWPATGATDGTGVREQIEREARAAERAKCVAELRERARKRDEVSAWSLASAYRHAADWLERNATEKKP